MEDHKLDEPTYGSDAFTEGDFEALSKIAAIRRIPHYAGTNEYQAGFNLGYFIRGGFESLILSGAKHLRNILESI